MNECEQISNGHNRIRKAIILFVLERFTYEWRILRENRLLRQLPPAPKSDSTQGATQWKRNEKLSDIILWVLVLIYTLVAYALEHDRGT